MNTEYRSENLTCTLKLPGIVDKGHLPVTELCVHVQFPVTSDARLIMFSVTIPADSFKLAS